MAEEKVFKVKIDGVEKAVQNQKDLKLALKQARDEQAAASIQFGESSKQYLNASKNVSALKDKLDDLNDSSRSLQGSGIERSAQGFSQLGEGLRNLDFDKVKVGLTAIKSALAATGIMLLVQGVTYLIQNFEELSKGSGIVAKALQFVGGVIDKVKEGIYFLTDALGLTNSELDKQAEALKTNADKAKESIAAQTAEYDRQIAIAKASGKNAIDLEIAKQRVIIETNKQLLQQALAHIKLAGTVTDEQRKLISEQLEAVKNASNQIKVLQATEIKEKIDKYKKAQAELKREDYERDVYYRELLQKQAQFDADINHQKVLDSEKTSKQIRDHIGQLIKASGDAQLEAASKELLAYDNQAAEIKAKEQLSFNEKMAQLENEKQAKLSNTQLTEQERIAIIQEYDKKEGDLKQARLEQNVSLAKQGIKVTQDITDLFFDHQLRKNKGNADKEREIKKKQFQLNKTFSLTQVVLDTVLGGIKALSQNPPPNPVGIISAALIGLAGTAASIKIATTKFEDGGSGPTLGGDAVPSMPSLPTPPSGGAAPNVNTPSSTKLDEAGNNLNKVQPIVIENHINEQEVTATQNRVNRLESQATFG